MVANDAIQEIILNKKPKEWALNYGIFCIIEVPYMLATKCHYNMLGSCLCQFHFRIARRVAAFIAEITIFVLLANFSNFGRNVQ